MPKVNNVEIIPETIQKTREHFAQIYMDCIEEVKSGAVTVNDPEQYFSWCEQSAKDALEGKGDHTLTFLQRAYYLQEGECIALLP